MRRTLLLPALLMIGACRFDSAGLPGAADRQPGDWPASDAGLRDGPADQAIVDQNPTAERRPDRAMLDARPEKALPPDQAIQPDQPIKPDQYVKPDQTIKPDQPPPPPPPCAASTASFSFQADMVICTSTQAMTQCKAASACNTGWHLCTASEYLSRGGKTVLPPATSAWIAGHIRAAGGAAYAPADGVMADCGSAVAPWTTIAWSCSSGTSWSSNAAYVGIITRDACRVLGVYATQNEAYWTFGLSDQTFTGAVCCK